MAQIPTFDFSASGSGTVLRETDASYVGPDSASAFSTSQTRYTVSQVMNATSQWVGTHQVSKANALSEVDVHSRARECFSCANHSRKICTNCAGISDFSARLLAKNLTELERSLGICTIDGVASAASVHCLADPKFSGSCWRNSKIAEGTN